MYNPLLDTLVEVADSGSFLKASEKLYISPTAVMKQMNQLERHIGIPLLIRTSQGITLTAAGKSIYKDAKEIMMRSRQAVKRAYEAQNIDQKIIRLGTSALYPCKVLIDLWENLCDKYPRFKLKVISFEDTGTETAFFNVGKKYDLMIGAYDSIRTSKMNGFLQLGEYHFCICMPRIHPLSGKKLLSYEDMHGETLMIQKAGNSPINDKIRSEIENNHPEITIFDVSYHYHLEVFNNCEEKGYLLLSLENWKNVHPSLISVPLKVNYTIPYGIIYCSEASRETKCFINALKENLVL